MSVVMSGSLSVQDAQRILGKENVFSIRDVMSVNKMPHTSDIDEPEEVGVPLIELMASLAAWIDLRENLGAQSAKLMAMQVKAWDLHALNMSVFIEPAERKLVTSLVPGWHLFLLEPLFLADIDETPNDVLVRIPPGSSAPDALPLTIALGLLQARSAKGKTVPFPNQLLLTGDTASNGHARVATFRTSGIRPTVVWDTRSLKAPERRAQVIPYWGPPVFSH
jgi:hypothetical protein